MNKKPEPYVTNILTASGASHQITGKITLEVKYKNKCKPITFYLCPSLQQEAYLGVDFWKIFRLAPEIMGVASIETENLEEKQHPQDNFITLNPKQQQELDKVVDSFLSYEKNGISITPVMKHIIELKPGSQPYKERHYPVSPAIQNLTYAEIDEMLLLNVIEECHSPWNNRVTLVRKPGKNRLCLDARKLNALTIKDAYPLPIIEGILGRLDQTHVISSIDLKHAFWQIELDEKSRQYTAFTVPGRPLYQYRVMPFGLCNAAQRLCRLMDVVIPNEMRQNVFVYLDDLLVISKDVEQHLEILEKVAELLKKANLTIGRKKSKFCCTEVKYLGYIVGGGKLRTNPEKVEAIKNLPLPKSIREVRSFLGTAGWYRRFIENFATKAAPLTDALKKTNQKFVLSDEAKVAFDVLKKSLTEAPVLIHPDFSKHFFIQCDACDTGIGAVLYQKDDDGHERPIAFYSQKLNAAQRNYFMTEKECLAAVMAVKKFRPYVELHPFSIRTDHASLEWLMGLKDLNRRLARWALQLQSFDFDITHIPGKDNVVADMLSRNIAALDKCPDIVQQIKDTLDEGYTELMREVKENKDKLPDIEVKDDIVYKKTDGKSADEQSSWKIWIPQAITAEIIRATHEPPMAAHMGIAKTLHSLRRFYFWPGMAAQVHKFIANCSVCKETKPSNKNNRPLMGAEAITDRPFQRLYIDFMGKYPRSKRGNAYLFVVLDHFSKYVFLQPMREATTKAVVKFLKHDVFSKFGVPETILSDNGKQFCSKEFETMISEYRIDHVKTAVYSPQANASERVNQSVLAAVRAYIGKDHTNWDVYMTEIECSLRNTVHSAIGISPYFAVIGQNMFQSGDDYKLARKLQALEEPTMPSVEKSDKQCIIRNNIKQQLHETYLRNQQKYNKRCRIIKYQVGQEVFRRNFKPSNFARNINSKFLKKFIKCRIRRCIGNSLYELESGNGKLIGIYHAKDLKQ